MGTAIAGAPEDQLRGPLDALMRDLAEVAGLPAKSVDLIGETTLANLKTRPDFAVTVGNALVGFIEIKAPGKGADPRQFDDAHDKEQWNKLKSLLVYTDGNAFSLWRDGIALGPAQADLLERICAGPLRGAEERRAAGAFALPEVTGASKHKGKNNKWFASCGLRG